jgi:hypothetical protein
MGDRHLTIGEVTQDLEGGHAHKGHALKSTDVLWPSVHPVAEHETMTGQRGNRLDRPLKCYTESVSSKTSPCLQSYVVTFRFWSAPYKIAASSPHAHP